MDRCRQPPICEARRPGTLDPSTAPAPSRPSPATSISCPWRLSTANGHVVGIFWPRDCLLVPLPAALTERKADVVVLWNDDNNIAHRYLPVIEQRITYYRYRRVDPKNLPAGKNELMVFVRK